MNSSRMPGKLLFGPTADKRKTVVVSDLPNVHSNVCMFPQSSTVVSWVDIHAHVHVLEASGEERTNETIDLATGSRE